VYLLSTKATNAELSELQDAIRQAFTNSTLPGAPTRECWRTYQSTSTVYYGT
jgi:hypothetical protein